MGGPLGAHKETGGSRACCPPRGPVVVICPEFNLCLYPPPLPASSGTYHQQKHVGFELGPLLRLGEEIERGLFALSHGWKWQLQGPEQPGLGGSPWSRNPHELPNCVPLLRHPQPAVPRQRGLSPAPCIWGLDTLPPP